jgi:hypothetical protein
VLERTVQLTVVDSLQDTLLSVLRDCGFAEIGKPFLTLGVEFYPAVAGSWSSGMVIEETIPNLSYNMLPGLIILVLHFTAVGLTAGKSSGGDRVWFTLHKFSQDDHNYVDLKDKF